MQQEQAKDLTLCSGAGTRYHIRINKRKMKKKYIILDVLALASLLGASGNMLDLLAGYTAGFAFGIPGQVLFGMMMFLPLIFGTLISTPIMKLFRSPIRFHRFLLLQACSAILLLFAAGFRTKSLTTVMAVLMGRSPISTRPR